MPEQQENRSLSARQWLGIGFAAALIGAILVFALDLSDPTVGGLDLHAFGGVLLAAGVLLMGGAALGGGSSGADNGGATDSNSIKAMGGLIAVVAAIVAVGALTVVTLTQLGSTNKDSMIAVTSSAFGIISAVVGAYLGIKITADTTEKASEQAESAAVSQHEAEVKEKKISTVNEKLKRMVSENKVSKEGADELTEASVAVEEAARAPNPSHVGGA